MQERKNISQATLDSVDVHKMRAILKKNLIWMALIFVMTNAAAYLYLRYTKPVYEAESELKLDIKQDATEFGIKNIQGENQNINMISGEIEQMTSRLFFNRVLDSVDLWVSYHSIGKLLNNEMYHASPFKVSYSTNTHPYLNIPIHFNFTGPDTY